MARLSWISDSALESAVHTLAKRAQDAKENAPKRMKKNVTDPFSSLVVASTFKITTRDDLIGIQHRYSALNGTSNALGLFHQQVLSSVHGWANHDKSYDLENSGKKIIAEIKNKHNTMNSKNRDKVENDLNIALQTKGSDWKAYLVIIVPRDGARYKKQLHTKRPIFEMDGASFYDGATGESGALRDLFKATIEILNKDRHGITEDVSEYCREVFDKSIPSATSEVRL